MIDSHCHLYFDKFDKIRDELVNESRAAGVHTIVNIGIDIKSSLQAISLTEQYDGLYATAGIHPHDAQNVDRDYISKLKDICSHKKVVALGEIGLDFYRDISPRNAQEKVFKEQLKLASDLNMPIVLHTRESFDKTFEIIKEYASSLNGGIFHCFPGDIKQAMAVIELGFHISVGGVITFNNSSMADVAGEVPLKWLLLETDAPFLTPVPFRGKMNKSEYVKFVYEKLAELRNESFTEIEKQIDRNGQKLFKLVDVFGE